MARYFFHLRDGADEVLDQEGVMLAWDALPGAALLAARDCMSSDVKAGKLDLRYRVDVQDGCGNLVHSVAFTDALEVVQPAEHLAAAE